MIIVSQDKEVAVEMKNLLINGDNEISVAFNSETWITIGRYRTKKRAKEELQNIIKSYGDRLDVYEMKEE